MYLLPSEQKAAIEKALRRFDAYGYWHIAEPCDCGSQIRHNTGGNYHDVITLVRDLDQIFVKYDTTCTLTPPAQWQPCVNAEAIIREYADWL